MTEKEIISIMNAKPKKIKTAYWNDSLYSFYYDAHISSSADIEITFSKKDSLVVEVYNGG